MLSAIDRNTVRLQSEWVSAIIGIRRLVSKQHGAQRFHFARRQRLGLALGEPAARAVDRNAAAPPVDRRQYPFACVVCIKVAIGTGRQSVANVLSDSQHRHPSNRASSPREISM